MFRLSVRLTIIIVYKKQRRHGDMRAKQVPYLTEYCLFHAQYDIMYIMVCYDGACVKAGTKLGGD